MRQIKAQDVKPGMEIEWKKDGWTRSGTIVVAREAGFSQPLMCLQNTEHVWEYVGLDQEVTVLKEAQPDEPTAFGACVEVGGVWFVRLDVRDLSDPDFQPWQSESLMQCTWAEVCDQGPVTVVNADPFASTEQREPRVWKRWKDVPDRVTVRPADIETPYRKVGDRIECRRGGSWVPAFASEYGLNNFSPFTEVLPDA